MRFLKRIYLTIFISSKMRVLLSLLLCAFVVFCAILIIGKPKKGRIFIVGVDGVDPRIVKELMAQKKLPNFTYLIQNGCYGVHNVFDTTSDNISSPEIWTSLVTGVRPEHHGITDKKIFYKDSKQNSAFLESTQDRIKPAIWNIFSNYGKEVGVVNWWVSYPAERVNGFIISNLISEMHWIMTQELYDSFAPYTDRASAITFPPDLSRELIEYRSTPAYKSFAQTEESSIAERIFSDLDRNGPGKGRDRGKVKFVQQLDGMPKRTITFPSPKALANYAYNFDRDSLKFAQYLLNRYNKLDLMLIYFEGIDIFSHLFWLCRFPHECPDLREKYNDLVTYNRDMLDNYYILTDIYLGRILQYLTHNDILIVCSDHGFCTKGNYLQYVAGNDMVSGEHYQRGLFIIYGRHIKKQTVLKRFSLLDVLPTVMYLTKTPLPSYLEGTILFDCIEDNFVKKTKPVYIKNYPAEEQVTNASGDSRQRPYQEETKTRLRALGYLQ